MLESNDNWYEFKVEAARLEWDGIYPTKWPKEDVELLEKLYRDRDIYIQAVMYESFYGED